MDDRVTSNRSTLTSGAVRTVRTARVACSVLAIVAIRSALAAPTTAPSTQPATSGPTADYEVRDWVVLVVDPNQPLANWNGAFKSTLPDVVGSRRTAAPTEQRAAPIPVGVIRLVGAPPAQ